MGFEITLSSKGQVVLPKDVRDALDLRPGERLKLERVGRRIIIEQCEPPRAKISYDEFRRRVPPYRGAPVAIEDMTARIDTLFRDWKA